jgi:ligand-binding sensor domain-containing protein
VKVVFLLIFFLFAAPARAEVPEDIAALVSVGDRLYVGGFDQGLYVVEPGRAARRIDSPALSVHINALAWSPTDASLWVGTARGVVRCRSKTVTDCRRLGDHSAVHALLVTASGELLIGSENGLSFARGDELVPFGKKQGAPFRSVWALAEGNGQLFIGATNGLFWGTRADFAARAKLARASVVQGSLPDDWVTALLHRDDGLYVGTYNAGVVRFRSPTNTHELTPDLARPALGYVNPGGLYDMGGGELAIASMDGLWHGVLGAEQRLQTRSSDVTAIARSANGYWIATRRGLEQWPALP